MTNADYALPALITLLALVFYAGLIVKIGMIRGKRNLAPSQASADEAFDRLCRIQVNTSEQLVLFLPALWTFAFFTSTTWSAAIGAV